MLDKLLKSIPEKVTKIINQNEKSNLKSVDYVQMVESVNPLLVGYLIGYNHLVYPMVNHKMVIQSCISWSSPNLLYL